MATLSYHDKFAWYGLRETPTYDQMLSSVRKPLHIPIPSREAKWIATGIYRSFLLDAQKKYHDYEHKNLEYDGSGSHLPSSAARGSQPSTAGDDPAWQEPARVTQAMAEEDAHNIADQAMDQERRGQTQTMRQQQLSSYGPRMVHPTIEAHHRNLEQANVPHPMPAPRPPMTRMSWPFPADQFSAAGHPQAPEFPTFEQLNLGQARRFRQGHPSSSGGETYQQLRENLG